MPSTVVLIARHADVHNPGNVFYGRLPHFPLSKLGVQQAERTAQYLANVSITAIYTSPQLRARQTARIIAAHHPEVSIKVTRLLAEVLTSWQGTAFSSLGPVVNVYEPLKGPHDETIAKIYRRMRRCLLDVVARHPGETTLCVSHADPIMILKTGMSGRELRVDTIRAPEYPEKGSITKFEFAEGEDRPRITYTDVGRLMASVTLC